MGLSNALQQLREERKQMQSNVEKLDRAISVIESLNGSAATRNANRPTRIISAASRSKMARAQRVTEVHAAGDFSFRNKRFTGDRWVLAGDAAGFIDPVWSSGVFIAVLSGEKAADMLDRTLRQPQRRAAEFARYERHVGRVMDLYLKFVNAWYTQEFAEVFFNPKQFFQIVPAVNSVLAGTEERLPEVRLRLWIFDFLVFLQKRFAMIAPRMTFQPK